MGGAAYDGEAKSRKEKKAASRPPAGTGDAFMDMFDELMKFLDEEFWLVFFAIVYAFSIVFFCLALTNVRYFANAQQSPPLPSPPSH